MRPVGMFCNMPLENFYQGGCPKRGFFNAGQLDRCYVTVYGFVCFAACTHDCPQKISDSINSCQNLLGKSDVKSLFNTSEEFNLGEAVKAKILVERGVQVERGGFSGPWMNFHGHFPHQ